MCIGCRSRCEPNTLLRFVCAPQGDVLLDHTGRAPGRGGYVCCDTRCLRQALKPGRFAAVLKQPVTVPSFDTLYDGIEEHLYTRLLACLSMAHRAGATVTGYRALSASCAKGRVVYMVIATDTAVARAEEYRSWCIQQAIPSCTLFTKEGLGRLLGKPSRSAVGLIQPSFCERLCATLGALERLQTTRSGHEIRHPHVQG